MLPWASLLRNSDTDQDGTGDHVDTVCRNEVSMKPSSMCPYMLPQHTDSMENRGKSVTDPSEYETYNASFQRFSVHFESAYSCPII
jgi:hypothetical protein